MGVKVAVKKKEIKVPAIEPKFRNPEDLPPESLTDPDYHLKQLAKLNVGKLDITCSKCHHCR